MITQNLFLRTGYFAMLILFLLPGCQQSASTPNASNETKESLFYYVDGQVSQRAMLVNGKKEGKMTLYYADGKVKSELWFKNDKQEGRSVVFYPEGQIQEVQYYQNGLKQGGDTIWYADGKIQFTVPFKDNRKNGYLRKWNEDGTLAFEARYDLDSLIEVKGQPVKLSAKPDVNTTSRNIDRARSEEAGD